MPDTPTASPAATLAQNAGRSSTGRIRLYFLLLLCDGAIVAAYLLWQDTYLTLFLMSLPERAPGAVVDRDFIDRALRMFGEGGAFRGVTHFLAAAPIVVLSVLGLREVDKLRRSEVRFRRVE